MFNGPPTPPPAPDSRTRILDGDDLYNYDHFLDHFDSGMATYQTQYAPTDSLPPDLCAYATPAHQSNVEASSVPWSHNPSLSVQDSTHPISDGQGLEGFPDDQWLENTTNPAHSEQRFQYPSGSYSSRPFDTPANIGELNQRHRQLCHSNVAASGRLHSSHHPLSPQVNVIETSDVIDQMFGVMTNSSVMHTGFTTPRVFPYGSDSGFREAGFISPAIQEATSKRQRTMIETMNCLRPSDSAANTRPSSPIVKRRKLSADLEATSSPVADVAREDKIGRHKTKVKAGAVKNDVDNPTSNTKRDRSSSTRKTRISKKVSIDSVSSESGRPCPGGRKGPRQNLTEDQKKKNHIGSEQRRRDAIKLAYDRLKEIVPSLRTEDVSRSTRVDRAVQWLEELLAGNEELKRLLSAAGGSTATSQDGMTDDYLNFDTPVHQ